MGKARVWPTVWCLCCLQLLLMQAFPVQGGSEFKLSGNGLGTGTMDGVILDNETIVLELGDSSLGNWTEMMAGYPSAREEPNFVYDDRDGALALFGGQNSIFNSIHDCIWLYNMTRNRWSPMPGCGTLPIPAKGMMAYDSWHGAFVFFGGIGMSGSASMTYIFNVTAKEWKRMRPAQSPSPRAYSAMAFDERNGVTVLFGGDGSSDNLNDTWTYNLTTDTWTEMNPATAPPPREAMLMAFDKAAGVTVMHSGRAGSGGDYGDTWLYNTSNNTWWRALSSGGPGSNRNTMAYDDADRLELVFVDGSSSVMAYNISANTWTSLNPPSKPPVYMGRGMGYDIANGAMVITGGFTRKPNDDIVIYDELWSYNLSQNAWKHITKPKEIPSPRHSHAMSYDEAGAKAVMFGGENSSSSSYQLGDTWTYDLATNAWSLKSPAKSPPSRRAHGMVYCPGPNVTVLFGGNSYAGHTSFNDTWTYDLATDAWKEMMPPDAPPNQNSPGMAYDESHGVVVLLTRERATWTYNISTNTWMDMAPTSIPEVRYEYRLVYDRAHDTIVAVLGVQSGEGPWRTYNYTDVWTYDLDANSWTNRSPTRSPLSRTGYEVLYDSARGETVMFGGGHPYYNGTTWQSSRDGMLWRYNLTTNVWTSEALPTELGDRSQCPTVYIEEGRSMVTFGGSSRSKDFLGDTWAFNIVAYAPEGTYVGPKHDTGGTSYYGTLDWTADVTPDTYLGLQVRTAETQGSLNLTPFAGPDGTGASFYETPGEWVARAHNASRWLQWRALLATWDPMGTPAIHEVSIKYNRIHNLTLASPGGGENWTGRHDILWSTTDPDGDAMAFDILLVNGTATWTIASNLANGTTSWSWDVPRTVYGFFCVTVVARDTNSMVPLTVRATSGPVALNHHTPVVELVSPLDGAEVSTTEVDLLWNATDEDDDLLDCYVFISNRSFSVSDLPPSIAVVRGNAYRATGLNDGEIYSWTVLASDRHENSTVPAVRSFTVRLPPPPNHPPVVVLASPDDGAVLDGEPATLAWNGTDEDGDALHYSVMLLPSRFDLSDLPEPLAETNATSIGFAGLVDGTTYYWTVMVSDGEFIALAGEVRHFTLSLPRPNHPPTTTLVAPFDGEEEPNTTVVLQWAGGDEDGDPVRYYLVLADAPFTTSALPARLAVVDATAYTVVGLANGTTYYWTVVPNDGKVNGTTVTIWSFTVMVPSPPPPPVNHAPMISGPAHVAVEAGHVLRAKVNATDEDGDPLVFSLLPSGLGIMLNSSSGELEWLTTTAHVGNHTVNVSVSDGRGGSDSLSMVVEVLAPVPPPPERRPAIRISTPTNGSRFREGRSGSINMTGTAINGSRPLERVQVRIDGGQWIDASGLDRWWHSIDLRALDVGTHEIEARAFDGTNYSDNATAKFDVRSSEQRVKPPVGLLLLMVIMLAIGMALLARRFMRKQAL